MIRRGAPDRPGRVPDRGGLAPGRRRIAGAVVLACVATGILAAAHRGWREGLRRGRFRPPFDAAGALALRPDGSVWRLDSGDRGPLVLVYVLRGCPHCEVELRRWDELLSGTSAVAVPEVWVVAPRDLAGDPWLPASLRARTLRDYAGSTGRALGADVVPTTAYVRPGGTVVALTRGQTPIGRIRTLVLELLEAPR